MTNREGWSLFLVIRALIIFGASLVCLVIGWTWMGILGLCIGAFVMYLGLR